jgi:hypothetical protein
MHFSCFLHGKHLFGLQADECPKGSEAFCFQAAQHFTHVMTSWCGILYQLTGFTYWNCQQVPLWSIDLWRLCSICCWARCGILQDVGYCKMWDIARCGILQDVGYCKMWDVARCRQYGGKLPPVCKGWYI